MAEFRAVPEADRDALRRQLRYAFEPDRGPTLEEPSDDWPPTFYDQRGLYDDGSLVSSCKLYTHEARLRGEFHPLGGLGAVATAPEYRNRGYARELCRRALLEFREADVGLVALWPVSTPLYRSLGWATANDYLDFELPPETLPNHDGAGEFTPLEAADWRRLRRVETAYGEGTALSLRRTETWWEKRTLADWAGGGTPYCYGYERDGDLCGYVIYTVDADTHRTLSVQDLAYVDEEVHRALLDFLGGHGTRIGRVRLQRAADSDLLHRVDDPADVDCRLEAGPMVRLTDVAALEAVAWPRATLECRLAVTNPLLAHNDGQFRLAVDGGAATVESVADGDADAAVAVDVGTLSQLTVGTWGVDAAERLGGLEIRDPAVREDLASVFTERPVCLREFF